MKDNLFFVPFFDVSVGLLIIYFTSLSLLFIKIRSSKNLQSLIPFPIPHKAMFLSFLFLLALVANVVLCVLFPEKCLNETYYDLFVMECFMLISLVLLCYFLGAESVKRRNILFFLISTLLIIMQVALWILYFLGIESTYSNIFKYLLLCVNTLCYLHFVICVLVEYKSEEEFTIQRRLFEIILVTATSLLASFFYIDFLLRDTAQIFFSIIFLLISVGFIYILIKVYMWNHKRLTEKMAKSSDLIMRPLYDKNIHYDEFQKKLFKLFDEEKPFLSPDLTIGEVAVKMFTNKVYLSKTINLKMDKNFRDFVNYYRVKEAMEIYVKNPTISISELCSLSGFRNAASFTNAFKLNSGYTPGEWCRVMRSTIKNGGLEINVARV